MNDTFYSRIRTMLMLTLLILWSMPSWAADRCAQFNLTLPAELGGTPTQKVEGGVMKNGKPLMLKSITCEFTTGKGHLMLVMRNNAKDDTVQSAGRVMSMSNRGQSAKTLDGVGDEALYSRNSSAMRKGTMFYLASWKWVGNKNVDLTAVQFNALLTAVLSATPVGGPQF